MPGVFTRWDSVQEEAERRMWHMLSIGPSRYGLPFHNHGQTWLAVVHGTKYWFVYPPGFGAPRSVDSMFSPFTSALDWYNEVYPHILESANAKAPLHTSFSALHGGYAGYRPLECRQHAGDILYLPSMWSHMTMNIGETIAIGGQQYLSEEERFGIAWQNYRGDQSTYETIKGRRLTE